MTISTPSGRVTIPGHVGGPEIKLRTIAVEKRGMTTTLFLAENIALSLELGMRGDRLRSGKDLTTLDLLTFDAAQQGADVVASLTFIKQLAEHLNTGTPSS